MGRFVNRTQRIRGLDFTYQPPPRHLVPYAAALRCTGGNKAPAQPASQHRHVPIGLSQDACIAFWAAAATTGHGAHGNSHCMHGAPASAAAYDMLLQTSMMALPAALMPGPMAQLTRDRPLKSLWRRRRADLLPFASGAWGSDGAAYEAYDAFRLASAIEQIRLSAATGAAAAAAGELGGPDLGGHLVGPPASNVHRTGLTKQHMGITDPSFADQISRQIAASADAGLVALRDELAGYAVRSDDHSAAARVNLTSSTAPSGTGALVTVLGSGAGGGPGSTGSPGETCGSRLMTSSLPFAAGKETTKPTTGR